MWGTSPLKTKWRKYISAETKPTLAAVNGKKPSYCIKSIGKYSGDRGRVSREVFTGLGMSSRKCQVLADNSWRSCNTVEGHIRKCVRELGSQ